MRRAIKILFLAIHGVWSPSMRRRVKVSDIWKSPGYIP